MVKTPLMVCTQARGGMHSVVEAYQRDGLFDRWRFRWLWTHCEGGWGAKLRKALSAYFQMVFLILRGKVSFMHVHTAMRGSFWRKTFFIATARIMGVPSILHLHGSEMKTFYQALPKFGKKMVKWSLENADVVVVLSESWEKFILNAAEKANVVIINNYVTLPTVVTEKKSEESFNVLFLGILGERKGVFDLLQAWPQVLKNRPTAKLLVGGNGEIEKSKQLAARLGISHSVEFLGWVNEVEKQSLLEYAHVFVLPSYNEGLPMSVLEAMSYQVPVVTSAVGGIPELIKSGENGLLVEPGDQSALSSALIKLGLDVKYRNIIAKAGRKRVKESFSDQTVIPKLEHIYAKIER